jgi:hypothetical protein
LANESLKAVPIVLTGMDSEANYRASVGPAVSHLT